MSLLTSQRHYRVNTHRPLGWKRVAEHGHSWGGDPRRGTAGCLTSTLDLSPSDRLFVLAMNELGFGRVEFLRIEYGELVLEPWPR
ncbi:MAG TPA: hypothetical protein VKV15_16905 [Bryobacteraceae bacterium]|nr:hypothetical protein [Bryobacteraceae bacterium]